MQGIEAGEKGGINIFSHVLFQNYSVFSEGLGEREGIFPGMQFDRDILLHKTFVFLNTSEFKIQSEF